MAVIPANNNTGLYNTSGVPATTGNDITVSGNVNANNFNATSQVNAGTNITAGGNVTATGNISTSAYFIGNGSLLTGIVAANATYANTAGHSYTSDFATVAATANTVAGANVTGIVPLAQYVTGNAQANITSLGTLTSLTASGNITGSYFLGNGSQLTGLPATYSNANVASYLASGTNTSNIITTGNVSGTYILGNGSQLTGLPESYSNANVTSLLANFGSNTISTTGNITGGNIIGTNLFGTIQTAAQPAITSLGTLTSLTTNGNVDVGGSLNTDDVTSTGNVTIYGNQVITGNLTVQGNTTTINSNSITTNDKTITVANNQSTGANVDGAGLEAGNPAIATWLYNAATNSWQSNVAITSTGNLAQDFGKNTNRWSTLYAGDANLSGNAIASYFVGNGSALTAITGANVTGTVANAAYATSAGTASTATNATHATVADSANSVTGGNVTGQVANALVAGTVYTAAQPAITSVGTLTGLSATGNITTSANVSGAYILGNGSQLTGIISSYGNSNVTSLLANFGSNTISTTGNITAGNVIASSMYTTGASGNITGANYITANYFVGNGSFITDVTFSGNLTSDLNGSNTYSLLFMNNLALSGAISNPAGDYVTIEGIQSAGGIITTGNTSANSSTLLNGGKFQGDFSSAVTAGRTLVQTTNTGTTAPTYLTVMPGPNNTGTFAGGQGILGSSTDVGNTSLMSTLLTTTDGRIIMNRTGTGSYLPFTIYTSGFERFRTDINGNIGIANAAPVNTLSVNGTGYFSGNVTVGGILTDGYYYANGTPVTFGGGSYGDSNVTTLLASLGSNAISSTANITTTGNVSGGNLLGIGSGITGINAFGNIAVSGQTTVSADNTTDTLTLVAGTNITLTTDAANNKITITSTASGGGDTLSPFLLMGG